MQSTVITGTGAVSAIGMDSHDIVANLRNLKSGIVFCDLGENFSCPLGRVPLEWKLPSTNGWHDRAVAFALHATERALLQAGNPVSHYRPERVTCTVSSSKGLSQDVLRGCADRADAQPMWTGDYVGLNITERYGVTGPVLNYPAACATGLVSVINSIHLLHEGIADLVVGGSAESVASPLTLAGFANMGAMSLSISNPFDKSHSGFNAGEGAGVFILEREDEAVKRGARPVARICGYDFRSDAHHMTAVEPTGETLAYCIRRTLERAGWKPSDVEYINAHGTGTPLNDEVEARIINEIFGSPGPLVSGFKPYVGHVLGASSSVELALMVMAGEQHYIPPTLNLKDPDFPLNHVPAEGLNYCARKQLKLSLGFGGHIAVLALELL